MMELPTVRRPRTARRASIAAILETLESRVVMNASPTAMSLQASSPAVGLGQSLTLNAFVVGQGSGTPVSEGTVTIRDGSAVLGTVPVVDGLATLTTTSLAIGTHRFSATYSGGANYLTSRTEVRPNSPVRTIAGSGVAGYSGDGGAATSARLDSPSDVAVDASGNIYIADTSNKVVRKVGPDGIISTFAGDGTYGPFGSPSSGSGGPATAAPIGLTPGVAVDAAGNLFITTQAGTVRKVGTDGIITTVAGNGVPGFSGDGGPATSAQLFDTQGVAVDPAGNLYFTEYWSNIVRKVSPDGIISTIAGIPPASPGLLGEPGYSGDGGPATAARVSKPFAVAADAAGNVYIADTGNRVVRKIGTDGIITTVAGNGASSDPPGVPIHGYFYEGQPATGARLTNVTGVEVDASGNIYFADAGNGAVRRVSPDGTLSTIASIGTGIDGDPGGIFQFQYIRGLTLDAIGNLYFADLVTNSVRMVSATTDVTVTPAATTAVLVTSAASLSAGQELTLIANVVSAAGAVDEGTATFRDGSTVLGTVAVVNGSASLAVSTLGVGTHQLTVSYDGGSRFLPDRPGVDAASTFQTVQISGPILAGSIDALTIGGAPRKVVADAAGNIYFIAGGGLAVGRITPDGVITRIAGTGGPGNSGDGGPAIDARFNDLRGLAVDAAGNVYLSDPASGALRKVTPDGIIRTVVGHGVVVTPASPDTLPLEFISPFVLDPAGNLYIQSALYGYITKLSPNGIYSNYAGTRVPGYSGDGGPATSAQIGSQADLTMDAAGNLYIVDTGNHVIRKVSPDGIITTVAGAGRTGTTADGVPATSARLNRPTSPAVDALGNLYFIDDDGSAIRRVSPDGIISTIARVAPPAPTGEGGPAHSAPIGTVRSLAVDAAGDLLVSEGNGFAVRRISATTQVDVTPAPAGFRITAAETSVIAGFVQTFTVTAVDADGNTRTDYDGWLTVRPTSMVTLISGNVRLVDGVGTFQAGLATAGVQRIFVSDGLGATPDGEIVLSISPNQAAQFAIDVERGLAGRQLRVSVTAQDVFGNTAVDYSGPIRVFSSDPDAVLPDDATLVGGRGEFRVVFLTPGNRTLGIVDDADPTLASVQYVSARPDPDAVDPYPDATFVRSLYRNVLGRAGSEGEVQSWVDGIARGMTREAVSSAFVRSIEHRQNQVRDYYADYLNRGVDPGSQFWVEALLSGASESSVIAGILSSEEYLSARQDDVRFIQDLYGDVLRRSADDVGLADKSAALAAGATRASLIAGILAAPEAVDLVLDDAYGRYLGRRRDPASAYWEGLLAAEGGSAADVVEGILASDEFYRVAGKIPVLIPPSH